MRKLQQRQRNDLSRSVMALNMDTTLIAVVEMSLSSWLVAGIRARAAQEIEAG